MGEIERAALEYKVVQRLSRLLEASKGARYSTTEALSHFTSILAWVVQRVNAREDGPAALKERWERQNAGEQPWEIPAPLGAGKLLPALTALRNASSHAGSQSSEPINRDGLLIGYRLGDARQGQPAWSIDLTEDQLRSIGLRAAQEFVEALRPAGLQ